METLYTQRLIIRKLEDKDASDLFHIRSNEVVNQFIERQAYTELTEAQQFIITQEEKTIAGEWVILGMELKQEAVLAGTICLFSFSEDRKSCELGYELHPSHQGRGLMLEALTSLLDQLAEDGSIQTLHAVIHPQNRASLQLADKLGFRPGKSSNEVKAPFVCYDLNLTERNLHLPQH